MNQRRRKTKEKKWGRGNKNKATEQNWPKTLIKREKKTKAGRFCLSFQCLDLLLIMCSWRHTTSLGLSFYNLLMRQLMRWSLDVISALTFCIFFLELFI